ARAATAKNESLATYRSLFRDDSVVLSAAYAREHGLGLESKLTLSVQGVTKTMIVRGILEPRGPATAFNGAIAIVDIATAQTSFNMARRLSRVDLLVPTDDLDTLGAIRRAV